MILLCWPCVFEVRPTPRQLLSAAIMRPWGATCAAVGIHDRPPSRVPLAADRDPG